MDLIKNITKYRIKKFVMNQTNRSTKDKTENQIN